MGGVVGQRLRLPGADRGTNLVGGERAFNDRGVWLLPTLQLQYEHAHRAGKADDVDERGECQAQCGMPGEHRAHEVRRQQRALLVFDVDALVHQENAFGRNAMP